MTDDLQILVVQPTVNAIERQQVSALFDQVRYTMGFFVLSGLTV